MSLLDRFLPVRPWLVTANGVHLGIYNARTAWGAKRFVGFHATAIPDQPWYIVRGRPISFESDAFKLENVAKAVSEALAKRSFVEDYSMAKKFGEELTAGLQWNVDNREAYVPGVWAVVEVEYEKTSKGKTKPGKHTFGVVSKYEAEQFIAELAVKWAVFADGLAQTGKPLPPVNNLKFTYYVAHVGWRKFGKEVDNYDIEDRHGRTKMETAFKQLKSL